jgi:predicted dehydrogenase
LEAAGSRQQSTICNLQSAICNQLEDNAFALLRTADGRVAQFHTSWTQWKNCFIFEVFGRDGYVRVDGLGGSYGPERLEVGRRKMEGGSPEVEVLEFPGPDLSWQAEWQEFTSAIREGRQPLANGEDGLQAMRLIDAIYKSARTGQVVRMENG